MVTYLIGVTHNVHGIERQRVEPLTTADSI
jgi:hypothetical protein